MSVEALLKPSGFTSNLATLSELTEDTILNELKGRYEEDNIYSYVGDILIATNPYVRLPLYTSEIQNLYKGGRNSENLPPHIFAVADRAYESMCVSKLPQVFVISGESGAGKTETTKFIVSHVIDLCKAGKTALEEKIKMVNPMLEAFGNAKTVMNNNSSRFGKYLELSFDGTGAIIGAKLDQYLLEKSRVAVRNEAEQNYHIFYQLFAGLSSDGRLNQMDLANPSDHHFLRGPGSPTDSQVMSDYFLDEWTEVQQSLHFVGFAKADIDSMIEFLAGILHIGDITFESAGTIGVNITSPDSKLKSVCKLLNVDYSNLERCLVMTTNITRGELVERHFDEEGAADNRDSFAKAIYARIFSWIFEIVNGLLASSEADIGGEVLTMGLLDIFGFENFQWNSLEQMCINVTNEQLQQYFNHHIFVMEQKEYATEGVDFTKIDFVDNQTTLDLFLKKGQGIFAMLDEQSKFPRASDTTFTEKCVQALANHESQAFHAARSSHDLNFTITHYAGDVKYEIQNFLEKNRDSLSKDVTQVLQESKSPLLARLFQLKVDQASLQVGTNKRQTTLCGGFKVSLRDLVERMNRCQPHFVRCIKPNAIQKPHVWSEDLVKRQLRYSGVLETIKIRKNGYSFRLPFEQFARRYKIIAYRINEDPTLDREACSKILGKVDLDDYQLGHNKVFMKYYHADILGQRATQKTTSLVFLQKIVKAFVARDKYKALLAQKRAQDQAVHDLLSLIEDNGVACAETSQKCCEADERDQESRPWMERVKAQAAWAEADKIQKQQEQEQELAKLQAQEPTKTRTEPVNGYFMWQRNEHATLRAGPLKKPWKKKVEKSTGRIYFKNTETKSTTWVDPRSKEFRKHDPLDCVGDELPYGWDEAETVDGVVFYIDHLSNTHHKHHPRVETERKQAQLALRESQAKETAAKRLATLKELREKRRRLHGMMTQAADDQARRVMEDRLGAIDEAIAKETAELEATKNANNALIAVINRLRKKTDHDVSEVAVQKAASVWKSKLHTKV